jgi:colanic acid biosynthesis glycosyl transferase WcaI
MTRFAQGDGSGQNVNIILLNQYYAPDEAATAQVSSDLGAALAAEGHSVTAICGDRSYADPSRKYPVLEEIEGVRVHRIRTSGFGRRTAVGRSIDYSSFVTGAMISMMRVERPDVIISLTTPPMIALAGAAAARLRGAKALLWNMDVYPDLLYALGALRRGSMAGRTLGFLASLTLRSQDAVVALGDSMAARLRTAGARRVEVVHNWSDEDAIVPIRGSESRLRQEWGWGDRFVVLYSGNLGLAHEFDTVLSAADRLRDDPTILFAFVGAGPRLEYVERRRDELQLPNIDIRRPVTRDLLAQNLAAGDVHLITLLSAVPGLVVPSKIYGILAAGRPTLYVGPAEGEVFHIITAAKCGTPVANGDVDTLVAAIQRYRDDAVARGAEGVRAREAFQAQYTKRRALEQFRAVLQSL